MSFFGRTVVRIVHEEGWKRKSIKLVWEIGVVCIGFCSGHITWLRGGKGQQHAFSFSMRGLGQI